MGTRNLTCVYLNGQYKVAQYGQWDGYPKGQGMTILNFLKNNFNKDQFLRNLNEYKFVDDYKEVKNLWLECGANPDSDWVDFDISKKYAEKYPHLHRDTGGKILELIQNGINPKLLQNDIAFVEDSLFCEWCYVIDFDKNTFEIYVGFNEQPLDKDERFYLEDFKPADSKGKYYPVKLKTTFDLDNLPNEEDFLKKTE